MLVEMGWDRDFARGLFAVVGTNLMVDVTKGIQGLQETKELVLDAFKEAMKRGPRAGEPVQGVLFVLHDSGLLGLGALAVLQWRPLARGARE